MAKEEGLFTVSEDEKLEQELISVAEEDAPNYQMNFQDVAGEQEAREVKQPETQEKPQGWLQTKEVKQFVQFLDEQMSHIPTLQHAQGNLSKMENAAARWKKLNNYCSEAMRSDFDGSLDVDDVDKKRQQIEYNMDALQDAIDGLHAMKQTRRNQRRRRRADEDLDDTLTKEAGTPSFQGFQVNITPFHRAIVSGMINGVVSGGRNMNDLWTDAKKKYEMNPREELEILQIMADMGYPEFKDRLRFGEKDEDPSRESGFGEWPSQYYA